MRPQGATVRGASANRAQSGRETGETLHAKPSEIRRDDGRPAAEGSADRLLDRVFAHLRAHVAELRRLEGAGAKQEELEERRDLIGQLQRHLAELVRTVLTSER
jgi:hypothetical protein